MTSPDPVAEARRALAELDRLLDRAATASTPAQRMEAANEAVERSKQLPSLLAAARTHAARHLWDSERMTLSELADKIGVSTQRAHQILGRVRSRERGDDG